DFIRRAIARRDDHDHDEAERDRRLATLDRRAKRRTWALVAVVVLVVLGVAGFVVARQLRDAPTSVAVVPYGTTGDNGIGDQRANGLAQAERLDGVDVQTLRPVSDVVGETEALLDTKPDL